MGISFTQMPASNRVPGPYAEVDGSNALGLQAPEPHKALIIGIRLSTGTATQGQIKRIVGTEDGDAFFGSKSMLALSARAYKRVNRTADLYAMAMDEDAGGVAATGTLVFAGTATADGSLVVRIGDTRVSTSVASGTANTAVASAFNTAVGAKDRCPCSSGVVSATVTLTYRHKGTAGNEITYEVESLPAGITVTPTLAVSTALASGATDPDIATAIAAIDEDRYDSIVVVGMTGSANMLLIEAEAARRWGPLVKQPGMVIAATRGSHGTLTTYGNARNSQYSNVMGTGLSPTPPYVWAAQVAARDAQRCDTQPNRPRNGLTLPDCEAPKKADRFDAQQRDLLLFDGISTYKVDQSGRVMIERLITTYQTNAQSIADATYLAMETQRNLARLYLEALTVGGKYGDFLLAPDGTRASPGVPIVTPASYRGEMVALNDSWERRGFTKDAAGFETDLICEINELDVERLDVQIAPRLVGGLVTLAHKISFQL